jgi:predicted RND superfamily exporter protein
VAAVRHFAPFAAIGLALAAVTPLLWLWALSPWISAHHCSKVLAGPFGTSLGLHLSRLARICRARRWWVVGAAVAVASASGLALSRIRADADFLHALPEHNAVRLAHERLDRDLTGVLAMDLLIDTGHKPGIADLTALADVRKAMAHDATITSWLSLAEVVDYVVDQATHAGSQVDRTQLLDDLSLGAPSVWNRFVGRGLDQPSSSKARSTTLRIMIRQRDASVAGNADSARQAVAAAHHAFPDARVLAASGSLLLDETSQRMIPATIRSTLLPLPCIAVLVMLVMRSLRLALLAIPMAGLPLLITYAGLVPMGWPVDVGVSMIACIALGMIVDDAVRMSIALGREGAAGPDASASVGPVLVGGCLAMAGSFIACLAGQFAYTRHFGVLLAAAFLVALVVNITVTPALFTIMCTPRRAPETS